MHESVETYTLAGARRLANMIMQYWQKRGYTVRAWPMEIPGKPRMFQVTSNLSAGLPRDHYRGV